MRADAKICAITGASGFLGGCLARRLQAEGWRVVPWTCQPKPDSPAVPFRLGQEVSPGLFKGVNTLLHCAYDFSALGWNEIYAANVVGSQKLLEAARKGGVENIVVISSLSAFAGCRSLYGQAKLQIEGHARAAGAFVLRPGLVYGNQPGGMFGRLSKQVRGSRIIPIVQGGNQRQYLVHEEDLGKVLMGMATGRVPRNTGPITVAHSQGWELKDLLARIASALGRRVTFVPVPWQLLWLALKSLELAHLPAKFRSDSLISMVYQDPHPLFELLHTLGYQCRPFELSPGMLEDGRS